MTRPVVVACLLALLLPASASARDYALRFDAKTNGQIAVIGNANMSCPTAATDCAAARALPTSNIATNSALSNDSFVMTNVDVDDDPATTNSSTSTLALPPGAEVLFAGLYWGGRYAVAGTPDASVDLKAPGGAYAAVASTTTDANATERSWQSFADVTARVQAAGAGVYSVAGIDAVQQNNSFSAWSLVVAYRDPAQAQARDLAVFDGYQVLNGTTTTTVPIPITGFQTPSSGPVTTDLGFVGWEGDRGLTPDSVALNGTTLSDAHNPATNFFNSSITDHGTEVLTRDPAYSNTFGVDIDQLRVPNGLVANGATSATVTLGGGERYYAGALTFSTDLYAPALEQTSTVTDVNGGDLLEGDVLHFAVSGVNQGQDAAQDVVVETALPAHTSLVAGSLDTSVAEVAANGGTYGFTFDAKVDVAVADGTAISVRSTTSYHGKTLPATTLTTESTATTATTVKAPDLALAITHVQPGGTEATFTLTATNVGRAAAAGATSLSATLPSGLTAMAISGPGWSARSRRPPAPTPRPSRRGTRRP